ncbi:MAG: methionyl-tRNA formyltransferase [Spirochaetes bacterium]|nr:methionyl-tRNA formyltransferase [Spirochaetota bacterium]MBN2771853.1 methionyl-tRNA formyltransferase [Spirochaetota bacterium]
MKIGFFGTPEVARGLLSHLCSNYDVCFVVTNCDKPAGRNKKVCKPPVKMCAEENNVEILQPETLKDELLVEHLKSFNADLFIVFAYGHLIPASVFEMPRYGTINLHPSKLPLYRGAAPVEWALMDGVSETAVSIQKITEKLDAGDILAQQNITIDPDMNARELYEKVMPLGISLVDHVIKGFKDDSLNPVKQNESQATYCKKISRSTARIDWNMKALQIHNLVRAMNPKPGAWSLFRDTEIKVWQTAIVPQDQMIDLKPGQLARLGKKRLVAGCGDGIIEIISIQPLGKKPMEASAFINGARLSDDESFQA